MKKVITNIIIIISFSIDVILLIITFGQYCDNVENTLHYRTEKWLNKFRL